jgi:hypothetical protein
MNYSSSITDGTASLEDGNLTCIGVISESIQTNNINIKNNSSSGGSNAIGKDIAIGHSLVVPNFYTTKIKTNFFETSNIKTDKIELSHNLQNYNEPNLGYIKKAQEIVSKSLLRTNTNVTVTKLALPIGVYIINYRFDIALSAISLPTFHSISHGLSSDNINGDILLKQEYKSLDFNNDLSFVTINETIFHHVKDFNAFLYVLATHNTFTDNISSIILQNINISAVRIA